MSIRKIKIPIFIVLLAPVILLNACNTVDGAGQDIEKAGEAVQDAAH